MASLKRILITPGEPAGIGPDITIKLAQKNWAAELMVIADPGLLTERAKQLGLPLQLIESDLQKEAVAHLPGTLKILPISLQTMVKPGELEEANVPYVLQSLTIAATLCQKKLAHAIVTGPIHKGIINQTGQRFTGHTEFFANFCGIKLTVMLFVVDQIKVALATTHLALADVPLAITKERLQLTLSVLVNELSQRFHVTSPKIYVCGLNPHAGEGGHLGREEIDTITPVLEDWRREGHDIIGPLSADTIFTPKYLAEADAVLAMYHDQALPVVKYMGFGHAVNLTLGLPFVRTSVDHGTALDMAGTRQADAGSIEAALQLAIKLA